VKNPNLIRVGSRRWFLEVGAAGLGGLLLLPGAQAAPGFAGASGFAGAPGDKKSVILIWLSGGPNHIDMWDPRAPAVRVFRIR